MWHLLTDNTHASGWVATKYFLRNINLNLMLLHESLLLLLKDQAKALNMPSRQMRWHPLVLKWCLRLYSKSHSMYSELREAGFLLLPSGRTLSDYKNFCSSKSGWQLSVLEGMRTSYSQQKLSDVGRLEALIFDK